MKRAVMAAAGLAALLAATGAPAFAQMSQNPTNQMNQPGPMKSTGQMMNGTAQANQPGGTESARSFVTDAIQGDMAEIQIGKLAQTKGATPGVRDGETLASDHTNAERQAMTVANSMGLTPPSQPKPEAQRTYERLSKLSGRTFDRAFLRAMVEDHQKDIREFQAQAKAGSAPASTLARQQLPTLEAHLKIAQSLEE